MTYLEEIKRYCNAVRTGRDFPHPHGELSSEDYPEMLFIYLSNLKFHLKEQNYLEARNSFGDLWCYNVTEPKIKYLIMEALDEFKL